MHSSTTLPHWPTSSHKTVSIIQSSSSFFSCCPLHLPSLPSTLVISFSSFHPLQCQEKALEAVCSLSTYTQSHTHTAHTHTPLPKDPKWENRLKTLETCWYDLLMFHRNYIYTPLNCNSKLVSYDMLLRNEETWKLLFDKSQFHGYAQLLIERQMISE